MANIILAIGLCLCLLTLAGIGAYTMVRCESRKRIWFIALLMVIFLFVLGYLLEITAVTADGAFVAIKVLYIGLLFLSPVFIMFSADFCEIKINRFIVLLLFIIPLALLLFVSTTDSHGLIYASMGYASGAPVPHFTPERGPLYFLVHVYPMAGAFASFFILIYRWAVWDKKRRMQILLLLAGAMVPVAANILFILNLKIYNINYIPLSMTIVCVLFCVNIIRHNIFDILPRATEEALKYMTEAFVLVDSQTNFLHANEAAAELLPALKNLRKETSINQAQGWPFELLSDENNKIISPVRFNISDSCYYNANISPLIDKKKNVLGYIIIIQDISESVLLTKKLEEIAYTDALTGIMNRLRFMEQAVIEFERAKRLNIESYIVMFDLDRFKTVNDTYGHTAGDTVLKSFAGKVKELIRSYDLFGRYGGEEFVMFVPEIKETDIINYIERIRAIVAASLMVINEETRLSITASFGIAPVLPANNIDTAINAADKALYRAKNEGRNKVVMADADCYK